MKGLSLNTQNLFIIPDLHGSYKELLEMLKNVPSDTKIIFLGDFIDRGDNSLKTLHIVMELVNSGKAYALKGNHEELFLNYLNEPSKDDIYKDKSIGGNRTLEDFLSHINIHDNLEMTDEEIAYILKSNFKNEIEFIENLNSYIKMEDYLFVHAGISPKYTCISEFEDRVLLWIREEFHIIPHEMNFKVFFGHTPTKYIQGGKTQGIWFNKKLDKFGLDGGCAFGGKLNGVLLKPTGKSLEIFQTYKDYNYRKNNKIKSKKLIFSLSI